MRSCRALAMASKVYFHSVTVFEAVGGADTFKVLVERFYAGRPEGPIKTFSLRGIKDSPPYLHDGRLLTLEDAVIFFDVVLGTGLDAQERGDLVAFLRAL